MASTVKHLRHDRQLRFYVDGAVGQDALRVLLAGRAARQFSGSGKLLCGLSRNLNGIEPGNPSTYRKSQVVVQLGWVDSDLESSPGWRAATVATYCPGRGVEHPKSKSPNPGGRPLGTPCTTEGQISSRLPSSCTFYILKCKPRIRNLQGEFLWPI